MQPADAEYVALRYADQHAGYRLASYAEVALPVYRVRVRTLVVAETALTATEVFILRAMGKGLPDSQAITGVLGLDGRVIESTLAELMRNDDVVLAAEEGARHQRLTLTSKGKKTLATEASEHPEETTITLYSDGVTGRVVGLTDDGLMTSYAVRDLGLRRIPTIKQKRPTVDALERLEVERMLDKATGRRRRLVSILSFNAIESRYVVYQPGVALVYVGRAPSDLLVSFAIDGHLSEEHETAFARNNGVRQLKIAKELQDDGEAFELPEFVAADTVGITEPAEHSRDVADALKADADVGIAEDALKDAIDDAEREAAEKRLKHAKSEAAQKRSALETFTVRRITMEEHAPLLWQTLSSATSRLLIVSPWIRARVVNHRFIRELRGLLKQGVSVFIGWGIGDRKEREELSEADQRAVRDLERLASEHSNLHFKYVGNTHAKVLICDERLAVYTSFNWLSFKGDPKRGFREENGVMVTIPEKVEAWFQAEVEKFGANAQ